MERQWEHEAIDLWFSLSYANYLVLPRSLLQSMPDEWQERFVTCLEQLNLAFHDTEQAPAYDVRVLKRSPVVIDVYATCEECDGEGEAEIMGEMEQCPYCDGLGEVREESRYETHEEVGFMSDPVPHYERGRTHVKRADEL